MSKSWNINSCSGHGKVSQGGLELFLSRRGLDSSGAIGASWKRRRMERMRGGMEGGDGWHQLPQWPVVEGRLKGHVAMTGMQGEGGRLLVSETLCKGIVVYLELS